MLTEYDTYNFLYKQERQWGLRLLIAKIN